MKWFLLSMLEQQCKPYGLVYIMQIIKIDPSPCAISTQLSQTSLHVRQGLLCYGLYALELPSSRDLAAHSLMTFQTFVKTILFQRTVKLL